MTESEHDLHTKGAPIPRDIACATCGKRLHCLTCFSVSVPERSYREPADFCGLVCLEAWASDQQLVADRQRRPA